MFQILEPLEFQVFHWRRRICKARDHQYYSAGPSKADGWKAKILSGKGLNPVNPHEHTDHRLYRPPPNHFSNSSDNWKYFANVSSRKAPMIITLFASGPAHNLQARLASPRFDHSLYPTRGVVLGRIRLPRKFIQTVHTAKDANRSFFLCKKTGAAFGKNPTALLQPDSLLSSPSLCRQQNHHCYPAQ